MVRRELDSWFDSLAPEVRGLPDLEEVDDTRSLFFTDANGCVARAAWEQVPFREVPYAEDQLLARDMLAAGYAKVYCPDAAVIHSHDYSPLDQLRRSFDEWRGLREVGAIEAPARVRDMALGVQRAVRDDVALARSRGRQSASLRIGLRVAPASRHARDRRDSRVTGGAPSAAARAGVFPGATARFRGGRGSGSMSGGSKLPRRPRRVPFRPTCRGGPTSRSSSTDGKSSGPGSSPLRCDCSVETQSPRSAVAVGGSAAGPARWYREKGRPVTIVMPTYGDPSTTIDAVRRLRRTVDRSRTRIIVVDDGSDAHRPGETARDQRTPRSNSARPTWAIPPASTAGSPAPTGITMSLS